MPLFSYSLYFINSLKIKNTVINTHHLSPKVEEAALALKQNNSKISISKELPNILGSGGALKQAENLFDEKEVIVFNGDNICLFKEKSILNDFYNNFINKNLDISFLACNNSEAGKSLSALWVDSNNLLRYVGKSCEDKSLNPLHYTGIYLIKKEIFSLMKAEPFCIFRDFVIPNLKKLKVKAFTYNDIFWHETGNLTDYLQATKQGLDQLTHTDPYNIKEILTFFESEYIAKDNQLISTSAKVDPSAQLKGFNVIGQNCTIDSHSSMENCVTHSGSFLKNIHKKDQYLF